MVLDRVICATCEKLGYTRPFGTNQPHLLYYDLILLCRPLSLLDAGRQMIVPSFPALLAYPAGQALGDERPILGAVLGHFCS